MSPDYFLLGIDEKPKPIIRSILRTILITIICIMPRTPISPAYFVTKSNSHLQNILKSHYQSLKKFSNSKKKIPFPVIKDMKIAIPSTENEQIPVPMFPFRTLMKTPYMKNNYTTKNLTQVAVWPLVNTPCRTNMMSTQRRFVTFR